MAKAKTKKQIIDEGIAKAVGAGKEVSVETVDFSDPNRPKTVLEVDFPILPVNQVAAIEGNAGKPIYQMSKWWARRRSSVFRAMLLAGAMKAPEDPIDAAKSVWDVYYANHQKKGIFSHLKVADVFMGGGTTLVEGTRLGMQMYGNDLNPVAWLVVKNEMTAVDISEVKQAFNQIEQVLKPQIMPYYSCNCPRGHMGKWLKFSNSTAPVKPYYDEPTIIKPTEKQLKDFEQSIRTFEGWSSWYQHHGYHFDVMSEDFNPFILTAEERAYYRYWGPEIIYTFWAKHGPCISDDCNHRTPLLTTTEIASKELSVKAWSDYQCKHCGEVFDVETQEARIAPSVPFVVAEGEQSYALVDTEHSFDCPSCHHTTSITVFENIKPKNKKIKLTLFVHPDWMKGSNLSKGGTVSSKLEDTAEWNKERSNALRYIEVRGIVPEMITCPETGITFSSNRGNIPKRSTFTCQSSTCGREQDVLTSIRETGETGPVSMYVQQCYCPECDLNNEVYGGRFFAKPNTDQFNAANIEWNARCEGDLHLYWPKSELPYGFMTHKLNGGIPNHGFTHWWKMFNAKQLIIHSQLLKLIEEMPASDNIKDVLMGMFQQYLRNQNMFCFWNNIADKMEPMFSNNNYHPKSTVIENNVFGVMGRGNLVSSFEATIKGLEWAANPFELVSKDYLSTQQEELAQGVTGKSHKVYPNDPVMPAASINNGSSTDLEQIETETLDLVITDPPFGGLLHYSELADFFYVWLRLGLKGRYPDKFSSEYTLKSLEAVSNPARHPEDPDGFYRRLLTQVWKESSRMLKPGGILSFTFHHSADEPWLDVLESLFEAGFYLEATYPIRSDETKGESGQFGSRTIEYDIIHVCRKRTEEPQSISWARLRKRMLRDIRQLEEILANHVASGLSESDAQVIRKGKALEYFSKHYGKVYVEEGRQFSVKEALIGINQLINHEKDSTVEPPPVEAEVMTDLFLRIFTKTVSVPRNEMQNYLRGTGTSASDFEVKNWCYESNKTFYMVDPLTFAREWKGKQRKGLSYDLDQTLFFIGACFKNSNINVHDTLSNPSFSMHPAVVPLLGWFSRNGGNSEIVQAAITAFQLCASWQAKNVTKQQEQLELFGMDGEE